MFSSQDEKDLAYREKYKELVALIKQKFSIEDVKSRYTNTQIILTFNDNSIVDGKKEDERPVKFLKAFGGKVSVKQLHISYLTETECKLSYAKCLKAIEALKQIKTPTGPDANPPRIAIC